MKFLINLLLPVYWWMLYKQEKILEFPFSFEFSWGESYASYTEISSGAPTWSVWLSYKSVWCAQLCVLKVPLYRGCRELSLKSSMRISSNVITAEQIPGPELHKNLLPPPGVLWKLKFGVTHSAMSHNLEFLLVISTFQRWKTFKLHMPRQDQGSLCCIIKHFIHSK